MTPKTFARFQPILGLDKPAELLYTITKVNTYNKKEHK